MIDEIRSSIVNVLSNKKFLVIDACTELEYDQLKSSLTKKIEGWRFHPLVKKRVWDGNVSFVKRNKIPAGLWKEIIDICKDYDFKSISKGKVDLSKVPNSIKIILENLIVSSCTR